MPANYGLTACDLLVLPDKPPIVWYQWQDYVPVFFGAVVVASILVAALPHARLFSLCSRRRRARFVHELITTLPKRIGVSALLGLIVGGALALWLGLTASNDRHGLADQLTVVAILGIGAAQGIWILTLGKASRTATVLGMVADVLGFWPIRTHPLAGLSYRESVISDLRTQLDDACANERLVALVGHSQGSVLVAWAVLDKKRPHLSLVTCGSPLQSLYAAYFPNEFTLERFRMMRGNVDSWKNFWRNTDPISTPLLVLDEPLPSHEDDDSVKLPDSQEPIRGHGDYWVDGQQAAHIRARLEG